MDDHSDDIRRPLSPRIEVYAGGGRKQWPDDLKAQIVADSLEPGAIVTDVARPHGLPCANTTSIVSGAARREHCRLCRWCRKGRHRRLQLRPGRRKQPL
ncbi:transposase [Bradyrhizobium sp. LLZ17]|uniref:Transposase n=1 Tax=Bradyrhizobium sp. LLZ17 TaxID=3239388 RepID=A0AB39XT25_9BRAD